MSIQWRGVIPAITTPFNEDLSIDHGFLAYHCRWMIDHGCTGIVTPGSLGEAATLTFDEKVSVLKTCVEATGDRAPVIAGISSLSTAEAVKLAQTAESVGCKGLMVLPPYVYRGDWAEMRYHVDAILGATRLSCMLYNNPVSYGTDFLPEHIRELSREHANLHAIKESSTDVRRVTAIRALIGDWLSLFVGVDDAIVEGIGAGAVGWIAGLVNALPKESVALFNYAKAGETEKTFKLYRWFLPLLRMDTVPKFVQLIKLVQTELGMGNPRVRPPRLQLTGQEFEQARATIRTALENRPSL